MKTTFIAAGVIIAAIILGAVFLLPRGGSPNPALPDAGTPQPTPSDQTTSSSSSDLDRLSKISLSDYDGDELTLGDFRGKPLVVNSWATWCPFCRQELPDFARLQEEFGDSIAVIAIDRQEPLTAAKGYTDEFGISEKMIFLLDPSDSFYRSIGGFSMPETIFIDSDGLIAFHKRGPLTLDEMKDAVRQYLVR